MLYSVKHFLGGRGTLYIHWCSLTDSFFFFFFFLPTAKCTIVNCHISYSSSYQCIQVLWSNSLVLNQWRISFLPPSTKERNKKKKKKAEARAASSHFHHKATTPKPKININTSVIPSPFDLKQQFRYPVIALQQTYVATNNTWIFKNLLSNQSIWSEKDPPRTEPVASKRELFWLLLSTSTKLITPLTDSATHNPRVSEGAKRHAQSELNEIESHDLTGRGGEEAREGNVKRGLKAYVSLIKFIYSRG